MNDCKRCHCDSTLPFSRCCGPIIAGATQAVSAKQLMRSRFSAFCSGNIDYLMASHHPSQRRDDDRGQLAATLNQCQWLELSIIDCQQGSADQQQGEVEFIASYRRDGQLAQLHERSRFVREQGQWFYLHGDILSTGNRSASQPKPGRNEPCFCGSGKKFKHCHGR